MSPIPIIEKDDLHALAWHLKQAFNIAKKQNIQHELPELYQKRVTRFRKDTFRITFNDALNALMKTTARLQLRKDQS